MELLNTISIKLSNFIETALYEISTRLNLTDFFIAISEKDHQSLFWSIVDWVFTIIHYLAYNVVGGFWN